MRGHHPSAARPRLGERSSLQPARELLVRIVQMLTQLQQRMAA